MKHLNLFVTFMIAQKIAAIISFHIDCHQITQNIDDIRQIEFNSCKNPFTDFFIH